MSNKRDYRNIVAIILASSIFVIVMCCMFLLLLYLSDLPTMYKSVMTGECAYIEFHGETFECNDYLLGNKYYSRWIE